MKTGKSFCNPQPQRAFHHLDALRQAMQTQNPKGADFLQYLLHGDIKRGKGFWKSNCQHTHEVYQQLLQQYPQLQTENPFDQTPVKDKEAMVVVSDARLLDSTQQAQVTTFLQTGQPRVVFAGGPASKIASILYALNAPQQTDIRFIIDSAKFSNESSSASYAHINHANALNAEFKNSGPGILPTLIKRNLFTEKDATIALVPNYRKVDLWLKNLRLNDLPVYLGNVMHGFVQQLKRLFSLPNEHDFSRLAGQKSIRIIHWLTQKTGVQLTLKSQRQRALFAYFDYKSHAHSFKENQQLKNFPGLTSRKLDKAEVIHFYSKDACKYICSVDLFPDNDCFVHGFDQVIRNLCQDIGVQYLQNQRICEVFYHPQLQKVVAIQLHDQTNDTTQFLPITHLGLSLGPKVTYRYKNRQGFAKQQPVPRQILATGVSCQVLFKITDHNRFSEFPFTGAQQTHFVEMAHNNDYVLVKLTGGGNIADTHYSRSYAINALANLLSVIQPDSGLAFFDVVCAWPCSRGINASNNGQLVRIADNSVIRFGEGGTGMTKMASNAQIMLDMLSLEHGLDNNMTTHWHEYKHTIIDYRKRTDNIMT